MASEVEKLFEHFAFMTVSELAVSYLRKYVKENPEKKKEVVSALALLIQELDNDFTLTTKNKKT